MKFYSLCKISKEDPHAKVLTQADFKHKNVPNFIKLYLKSLMEFNHRLIMLSHYSLLFWYPMISLTSAHYANLSSICLEESITAEIVAM